MPEVVEHDPETCGGSPGCKICAYEFRKNWNRDCLVCGAQPTVGDTELCGPCCFGEAETAGGNW
jgi:hypothetical protein